MTTKIRAIPQPPVLRRGWPPLALVALVLGLGTLSSGLHPPGAVTRAAAAPAEAAAQACSALYWHRVAVPGGDDQLGGVSSLVMISPTDGWAAGSGAAGPLLLHWDGTQWTNSGNLFPGANYGILSFSALASNDVWAVGLIKSSLWQTLVIHWDGAQWTVVPSPNPGTLDSTYFQANRLNAVTALAANDVWAVGEFSNDRKIGVPLALHWDGAQWAQTPLATLPYDPDPYNRGQYFNELNAIYAPVADNVWAVGRYVSDGFRSFGQIQHWDGQHWSLVPASDPGVDSPPAPNSTGPGRDNDLFQVAGSGPENIWAAGEYATWSGVGIQARPVLHSQVERWDGTGWHTAFLAQDYFASALVVLNPQDVWIGGTALVHWDGSTWTPTANVEIGPDALSIGHMAAVASTDIWAAGAWRDAANDRHPLILHATCAPFTSPTPSPTETPAATATPVPTVEIPGGGSRTFAETGQTVRGLFLDYWNAHGGLAQQGYPIAPVLGEVSPLDGKPYTVQYFERAVFEYHPENAGSPYAVLLSQLGTYRYQTKYGTTGAANQKPNQAAGASHYFAETGHWVGGAFWAYWQSHGGLAQQGYPISDEFTEASALDPGQSYQVQYFERAVFERHPENAGTPYEVLLAQLGTYQFQAQHGGH